MSYESMSAGDLRGLLALWEGRADLNSEDEFYRQVAQKNVDAIEAELEHRRKKQRPNSRKHPAEEAMSDEDVPFPVKINGETVYLSPHAIRCSPKEEIQALVREINPAPSDTVLLKSGVNLKPKKRKAWIATLKVMLGDVVKWSSVVCALFWPLALGIYLACTSDYNPAPEGSEAHAFGPAFSWSGAGFLWQLGWATLVIVAYIWLPRWRKSAVKRAKGEG